MKLKILILMQALFMPLNNTHIVNNKTIIIFKIRNIFLD
jgi:hypothetical protein